jgi:hypothetical protein
MREAAMSTAKCSLLNALPFALAHHGVHSLFNENVADNGNRLPAVSLDGI